MQKIVGMIIIFSASLLIIDYSKWKVSRKGIILIILATITSTIYAILLKKVIGMSGILSLTFLACLIPAIINAVIIPDFFNRAKKEFSNIKMLLIIAAVGVVANLAMIKALSYDVLSGVYFIMDASLVLIIFGEHFILKEKERLPWKIAAVILAIVGAILLQV
jgi:drug/metabolite transporter (DMT)-like permease